MSFKFGLNVKNKTATGPGKPGAKLPVGKKKPLFDDEEDVKPKTVDGAQEIGEFNFDDTLASTSEASKPAPSKPKKGAPPAPPSRKPKPKVSDPTHLDNSASAREAAQRAEEALKHDSKLYDYDAAYDALHARTAAKKAAEAQGELRPKYMDSLFEAAELRKKDQLRARDKFLQRERETEGDEFADKEKFVTGAYKEQQEETRKAEEEERKRQEAEEQKRKKSGMLGFHKQMLLEKEREHQEAMQAAEQAAKEGFKIDDTAGDGEKSDAQIVEELRQQGKNVILNDDGQVADKRQLLTAGLNIVAKPKPAVTPATTAAKPTTQPAYTGSKSGRNAQRERQTAMIAQQLEVAAKRKADEEAEEQAKLQHASKSQKTEGDILSAKERYLKRKAEAAAAKAAAGK
ncbi:coiled-coil domain-containing protein 55-domain containing protein [Paraphoma chrysanthemicola]|nr:coiled-coil domain-containing protein 55-domain containing protein [Paraphoma chrysanthemicola]